MLLVPQHLLHIAIDSVSASVDGQQTFVQLSLSTLHTALTLAA
jgi:hypothetical protein